MLNSDKFENRILKTIYEDVEDEDSWKRKIIQKNELQGLVQLRPDIVQIQKSCRLRWAEQLIRMKEKMASLKVLMGQRSGREGGYI